MASVELEEILGEITVPPVQKRQHSLALKKIMLNNIKNEMEDALI